MIEIKGKYNNAKVFVDDYDKLEETCYKQILNLLNQKFSENSQIRIMKKKAPRINLVLIF